ncbi:MULTISPECIES: hypothetical protein [Halorussus]|uniref:hypothetical protein n=1 Tax=Halorussus TaxID=1070314 RepID=UPI00209EF377|nr:hypothetical protein [Halorussus vallis]USZ75248.1 hypothetical protein NGM07_17670 [Halorussus vallis]
MGTVAVDIETASPHEEPPDGEYDNTDYFELVAVALGYRSDENDPIETEVLFREGGWEPTHTADLLGRTTNWLDGREFDDVLTYNGSGFDLVHLLNWARETDDAGLSDRALDRMRALEEKQIDLKFPAIEHHGDLIWKNHEFPKFEKVCTARSVPTAETKYADYDVSDDFLRNLNRTEEVVEGWHIGTTLGEQYVAGISAGLEDTLTYRELERLLFDYAEADVTPLFELFDSFEESGCMRPDGR